MKRDFYKSSQWLRKRYVLDKKSLKEIADECGVTEMTVYNWLKKFDLIRDSRSWKR